MILTQSLTKAGALLLWGMICLCSLIYAYEENIRFERISVESGLSNRTVWTMVQDSTGFLWFATGTGLDRFDGYEFTSFRNDPGDPNSLSNNVIYDVYQDSSDNLWIGTEGGLNMYHLKKRKFLQFPGIHETNSPINSQQVLFITEAPWAPGVIWVGTHGTGLLKLVVRETGDDGEVSINLVRYKHDAGNPGSLSNNFVRAICPSSAQPGILWLGTDKGLDKFDCSSEEFIAYFHEADDPESLTCDAVRVIIADTVDRGILWLGTKEGLYRFDTTTNKFNSTSLGAPYIHTLYMEIAEEGQYLWVGTAESGVCRLDIKTGKWSRFVTEENNPASISFNEVTKIFRDRSGVLWFCTRGGGLNRFSRKWNRFTTFRHEADNPHSLSNNDLAVIYEAPSEPGITWIGTSKGLNKFNPKDNTFTRYYHVPTDPDSLSHDTVWSVYEDSSRQFWVGTRRGLDLLDRKNHRFRHFTHDPRDSSSLSHDDVMCIYEAPFEPGVLWVGTYEGLNRWDKDKKKFTRFRHNPQDPNSLSYDYIRQVYQCPSQPGILWVATLGGLNKYDCNTGLFTRYVYKKESPQGISNNWVLGMVEDSSGRFWLGTWQGLNLMNRENGTFTHYTEKDGLPNDVIYGILEYDDKTLWISTDKGITVFNPDTKKVLINYNEKDGLQSDEFSTGAYCRTRSGEMYFGGINGFNVFHPAKIKTNTYIPMVVIKDFEILSRSRSASPYCSPHFYVSTNDTMKLSYQQNAFSFKFAALDYNNPGKNRYMYMLEGYDDDWKAADESRTAIYSNIKPGEYVFRVKGSNNDGVWNELTSNIRIVITSPFWRSAWFWTPVLGVLLILFPGLYIRKLWLEKKRVQMLLKQQETPGKRYEKSTLTPEQADMYLEQLLACMKSRKPYLESDLTLKDLADQLAISSKYLSQVINEKLNQHFLDFINSYRVEEAKKRLLTFDPETESILDIAFDVGFCSKSTFNTVFKKYTKMTPSQFRKKTRMQKS
jgi:ligand-binding sensor domain-containing protein/AraC-like DNA-binding protein